MTNNGKFNLGKSKENSSSGTSETKPKSSFFSMTRKAKDKDGHVLPDNSLDNFVPGLPEVNLLPPRVKEKYASRDLLAKFIKGGIGVTAVFGLLYGASFVTGLIQENKIDDIKAETATTQNEITALAPYSGYRQQVESKRSELSSVSEGRMDSGKATKAFKDSVQDAGYKVVSYSLSVASDGEGMTGSCVNPDPFTPSTGVACVTFSLEGDGNLSKLYTNFNNPEKGFVNIYIPSTTNNEEGSTLDGSVSVTNEFALADTENLSMPLDTIISGATESNESATTEEGNN